MQGPGDTRLDEAATLATRYLVLSCGPDGKFAYRINLDPRVTPAPKYNVLRHAGAMYALTAGYERRPQEPTLEAIRRAGRFLRDRCIGPVSGHDDLLAVWSAAEMTHSGAPLQAKLGGSGLGLVALLSQEQVEPGSTPIEILRGLGRFLLFMQKNDGSFYSKYIPASGGRDDSWTSLYYPGEAALGLVMLYEHDPSPPWLQAAAEAIAYLARSREDESRVPADHWALLATARLLPLYDRCDPPVARKVIVGHAIRICRSMLSEQVLQADDPVYVGGFSRDGRTTPTATRLEGLLAALTFLSEDPALRNRIISSVQRGLDFLLAAQLREGPYAGAIPRAVKRLPAGDSQRLRSFNKRATEVRIDYVQHGLSAVVQYERMFGGAGS